MALATLTNTGRAAIALSMSRQPLHFAWGSGLPEWDHMNAADLPSYIDAHDLHNEVGRRKVTVVTFAKESEEGDISIPVGKNPDGTVQVKRYLQTDEPTKNLLIRVTFDYEDASNAIIREAALFMDTVTNPDLPPGQLYFSPADVIDKGHLLAAQIVIPSLNRSPSIRPAVDFVLPI